jgi:poly(A) polymerase
LTGEDLIALGLAPGPLFREILAAVEDAQLNGEIGDPEQARAWVRARWGALPQLLP